MRMCSCRGPHAGFVHIRCLVKNAEERGEYDDAEFVKALNMCSQCRQQFHGPVNVALKRAAWLHFAGRGETDRARQLAICNLGAALFNMDRLDDALVVFKKIFATRRRLYGPDDFRTIDVEESLAETLCKIGGEENLRRGLETLTRTYEWKCQRYGRDHKLTLASAIHLASIQRDLGMLTGSIAFMRRLLPVFRRVHGEQHAATFEAQGILADLLVQNNEVDEARDILLVLLPVVRRVLGPHHAYTRRLENPHFFDPSRFR